MARWAAFFIFVFICSQIIAVMIEGGGFAVNRLNGAISETTTTVTVDSTSNFLSADVDHLAYFILGTSEIVSYTGKTSTTFTGCVRGASDPQTGRREDAAAHADNTKVKTLNIAAMDSFMGYNITTSGATFGTLDAVKFVGRLFINMPKFLLWDYPWLTGPAVIARFPLFALSGGFVFGIGFALITLAKGLWGG